MNGKICLVTGASAGIGKETAKGLAALGARVVLACRSLDKSEEARRAITAAVPAADIESMRLDLADLGQVRDFSRQFKSRYDRLDVLLNNAGIWKRRRATTQDGIESVFGVNHLGPSLLTLELLPLLKSSAPSRIVFVASDSHYRGRMNWRDLEFKNGGYGPAAYRQSKLANVLFAKALARRLMGSGVTVNALHPGVIATQIGRDYPRILLSLIRPFRGSPAEGAHCSVHVAAASELEKITGEYFRKSRPVPASVLACDAETQEKLWETTLDMLRRSGIGVSTG